MTDARSADQTVAHEVSSSFYRPGPISELMGILDTVKLAGVLVFAIPAALAGLEMLVVRGEVGYGIALLVLSVMLVVIQRRLKTPGDIPGLVLERVRGSGGHESETNDP